MTFLWAYIAAAFLSVQGEQSFDVLDYSYSNLPHEYSMKFTQGDTVFVHTGVYITENDAVKPDTYYKAFLPAGKLQELKELVSEIDFPAIEEENTWSLKDTPDFNIYIRKEDREYHVHAPQISSDNTIEKIENWMNNLYKSLELEETESAVLFDSYILPPPPPPPPPPPAKRRR